MNEENLKKTCGKCGKEHYKKHKNGGRTCSECASAYGKEWYRKNIPRIRAVTKQRYYKDPVKFSQPKKRWATKLRDDFLFAYGNKCACCGELTKEFLTFDHVNNDGAEHRREINNNNIYVQAKRDGYPDRYQILCWNCNCSKYHYGKCPHERA